MNSSVEDIHPYVCASSINWKRDGTTDSQRSWQTMVQHVVGFRICIGHDFIQSIVPLLQHQIRDIETNGSVHVFLLRPSEVIVKVEGNISDDGDDLQGIRFTTTDQISQWYGNNDGTTTSLELKNPLDYIHSFLSKYQGQSWWLHAVVYPRNSFTIQAPPVMDTAWKKVDLLSSDHTPNFIKTSLNNTMDALIFHCPSWVESVEVLSQQEYKKYLTLAEHVIVDASDRWFVLLNEKLLTVEAAIEDGVVTGLRLKTATRTSPWFGEKSEEVAVLQVKENQRICGFYGFKEEEQIKRFGVVFMEE